MKLDFSQPLAIARLVMLLEGFSQCKLDPSILWPSDLHMTQLLTLNGMHDFDHRKLLSRNALC